MVMERENKKRKIIWENVRKPWENRAWPSGQPLHNYGKIHHAITGKSMEKSLWGHVQLLCKRFAEGIQGNLWQVILQEIERHWKKNGACEVLFFFDMILDVTEFYRCCIPTCNTLVTPRVASPSRCFRRWGTDMLHSWPGRMPEMCYASGEARVGRSWQGIQEAIHCGNHIYCSIYSMWYMWKPIVYTVEACGNLCLCATWVIDIVWCLW